MNQEEVDVVKAEVLQGLQEGGLDVVGVVFVVPNLAGHEDHLLGLRLGDSLGIESDVAVPMFKLIVSSDQNCQTGEL